MISRAEPSSETCPKSNRPCQALLGLSAQRADDDAAADTPPASPMAADAGSSSDSEAAPGATKRTEARAVERKLSNAGEFDVESPTATTAAK